ncbi:MAG: hypothetical protein KBT75_17770 [Oleispira antarctica]|nr:hypothetical protein [Oleispira antarctica]|tara:strand:- start:390 stop:539 length:150 start_codon:yes stop_codon:yes gene_type:complete
MDTKKPKHIKANAWKQHLKWMDVGGIESKANQLKREKAPRKDGRLVNYY